VDNLPDPAKEPPPMIRRIEVVTTYRDLEKDAVSLDLSRWEQHLLHGLQVAYPNAVVKVNARYDSLSTSSLLVDSIDPVDRLRVEAAIKDLKDNRPNR
jgi:hypothetical protein